MADSVELSEREQEILRRVATGASNKEIALQLRISPNTVKVHLRNIFVKIDVLSRTEATIYAIRHGLAPTPTHLPGGTAEEDDSTLLAAVIPSANVGEIDTLAPISISTRDEPLNPPGQPAVTFLPATPLTKRLAWIASAVILVFVVILAAVIFSRTPNRPVQSASATMQTATQEAIQATVALRWQIRPSLPQPLQGMAAAVYDQAIYIIGGENSTGMTDKVECYSVSKNVWESRAAKPTPVADIQAVLMGEKIYVPGGRLASGKPTTVLEVYDPRHDQWETKAPLPVAISGYALASLEGRLYLFGGWDGSSYLNTVYAYDPVQDAWTPRTPMPVGRAFAGAVAADEKIFIIGGFDGQHALANNEVYYPDRDDSSESPWSELTPLPQGRYAMGATNLANIIYLVGGKTETATSQQSLQYIMDQDTWQPFDNPATPAGSYLGIVILPDRIAILGGQSDGKPSSQMQFYQAIYKALIPGVQNSQP